MLTNEKRETSVVATSPFLDVQQAAGELGTTWIHVLRLIARGVLKAIRTGNDWRVRPADLDAYGRAGTPDADAPAIKGGWFDVAHDASLASQFAARVQEIIQGSFLPAIPRDAQGKILTTVNVPVVGALAQLIRSPAPTSVGGIRFAGEQPTTRYATAGELYAAVQIRSILLGLVRRQPASPLGSGSDLAKLYESPERYAGLTATAVEQFNSGSISLTKQYPYAQTEAAMPTGITVAYRVPHASMGIDMNRVLRAAL